MQLHGLVKGRALAAVGVDDQHLRMRCGVALNEACQLRWVVPLIQHVAANDQVKLAQQGIAALPMPLHIRQQRQTVQAQIGA